MSDPCLLTLSLLTKGQISVSIPPQFEPTLETLSKLVNSPASTIDQSLPHLVVTPPEFNQPDLKLTSNLQAFSRNTTLKPVSGSQLYQQRLAAIKAGKIYTRLPSDSFFDDWSGAINQPTYQEWKLLLEQEARAIATGQGSNRLAVLIGDSLSLWFPPQALPGGQLWLNQGISGDTTDGILNRLSALDQTRPDHIYLMAGINDIRRGMSDQHILYNLREIMQDLRYYHPEATIIVQSIMPTNFSAISNRRIRALNQQIARIARTENVTYLDLYSYLSDRDGNLRPDLTTDGIHLTSRGYNIWQWALKHMDFQTAFHPNSP